MDACPTQTICVLTYGDHLKLAQRCLESLRPLWESGLVRLRLGVNAPSPAVLAYLDEIVPYAEFSVILTENLLKYPIMWRLFHDEPLTTPLVQWFDDDSYLTAAKPADWLARVEAKMTEADMLGQLWHIGLRGNQHQWVQSRAWYTGKPIARGQRVDFATGGWWCIRRELIERYRWPEVEILHCGGDVMLGELCRQQDLRLRKFDEDLQINKAKRRGHDEPPVGTNYHGQVDITRQTREGR